MQNKKLNKRDIQIIQRLAREKLIEYCKLNDVIGTGVFSILEKDNKVLYYPLEDQQVWGCTDTGGKVGICPAGGERWHRKGIGLYQVRKV